MNRAKKTWRKKLADDKGLPKVIRIEGRMSRKWGEGTCAIAAPAEVDQIMKSVHKGRLITINEIRAIIAKRHGATIGCPITTGIFAWIAAHAAEEDRADGKKRITPYWRTLKTGGLLNEKYPGGVEAQKKNLEAEGHKVVRKGRSKNFMVEGYEAKAQRPKY